MQEPSYFGFSNWCGYHFQGRRLIKEDCNDNKCVTSTTFDRTQDTAASQGTDGQEDGDDGTQGSTATCPYHFFTLVVVP